MIRYTTHCPKARQSNGGAGVTLCLTGALSNGQPGIVEQRSETAFVDAGGALIPSPPTRSPSRLKAATHRPSRERTGRAEQGAGTPNSVRYQTPKDVRVVVEGEPPHGRRFLQWRPTNLSMLVATYTGDAVPSCDSIQMKCHRLTRRGRRVFEPLQERPAGRPYTNLLIKFTDKGGVQCFTRIDMPARKAPGSGIVRAVRRAQSHQDAAVPQQKPIHDIRQFTPSASKKKYR